MKAKEFLAKHFDISDPRWISHKVEIHLDIENYSDFIFEAVQSGAIEICSFGYCKLPKSNDKMISGLGYYRTIFKPFQNRKLSCQIVRSYKLPIIDRVIVCDEMNTIIPNIYVNTTAPAKEMKKIVNGIYWNFKFWNVDHVILTSDNRKNIKMIIENKSFNITDEQFVTIFD